MALQTIKATKEITFTGSPQNIVIQSDPLGFPVSGYSVTLNLFVWTGFKTSIPVDPVKVLNATSLPLNTGQTAYIATFEIAQFIREHINELSLQDASFNEGNGVWFQYTITDSEGQVWTDSPVTQFATGGYGFYKDGPNPGTTIADQDGKVFGTQAPSLLVSPDMVYKIPVFVGQTSQNVSVKTSLGSIALVVGSIESNEQIKYVVLSDTTIPGWTPGVEIEYYVDTQAGAPLYGISFDGFSTYMDLGIIPGIQNNGYTEVQMKAIGWEDAPPFGYDDSIGSGHSFYINPVSAYALTETVCQSGTSSAPFNLLSPELLSTHRYEYDTATDYNYLWSTGFGVAPVFQFTGTPFNSLAVSPIPFYIGGMNSNAGPPIEHTEVVVTYINASGTLYNDANNWGGATNYGGVRVVSYDDGVTFAPAPEAEYIYKLTVVCQKGTPIVLRYQNQAGSISDFPVLGAVVQEMGIERLEYKRNVLDIYGNYDVTDHQDTVFNVNGQMNYPVHTGWTFESANEMIRELLLSKHIWAIRGADIEPVVIMDSTKRLKTRVYGARQIGYELTLKSANQLINKVS